MKSKSPPQNSASIPQSRRKSDCPIHYALEAFGDRWTLLIVRDLMFKGRTTYTDFLHAEEGIATNVLADRLARLQRNGVVKAVGRSGYRLTPKGMDLLPVLLAIIEWSAQYDAETATDATFIKRLKDDRESLTNEIRNQVSA